MMKAELGLIPIAHGGITVLGRPAGAMNHRIGYVPQSYASDIESNITAEQSVLLGLTGARFGIHPITRLQKDKVRNALEFVGMQDKARYRLSELSRRPAAARRPSAQALVSDPQLLMLDEPLANLDLASQRATVHVLAKLNRELGMSIQVVAHDLNMLLPILTGAVYLLDGHPHYAKMNEVLDSKLLTHLYGTTVQVVTTPQAQICSSLQARMSPMTLTSTPTRRRKSQDSTNTTAFRRRHDHERNRFLLRSGLDGHADRAIHDKTLSSPACASPWLLE